MAKPKRPLRTPSDRKHHRRAPQDRGAQCPPSACADEGCPPCPPPQRARNHYFTGKLLVERDFRDEQAYHLGNVRRHNQRLHGWGTVCGLKIVQHENPSCRDHFVVLEPGTAIDCCGREILVEKRELFDFRSALLEAWRAERTAAGEPPEEDERPDGEHRFEIRICHLECPVEPMPALFEGCEVACTGRSSDDADGCQPNRIVEGFALELRLDPPFPTPAPLGQHLDWCCTVNLAQATAVAAHAGSGRAYVLSATGTLWQLASANQSLLASRAFAGHQGLRVAVSADGARVYVVTQESGTTADPVLWVLDTADLAGAPVQEIALVGARGGAIELAARPEGGLAVLDGNAGKVLVWGADLDAAAPPAPPLVVAGLGGGTRLGLGEGGAWAYVLFGGNPKVAAVELASPAAIVTVPLAVGFAGSELAVASDGLGDVLAVVDAAQGALQLVAHRPTEAAPIVPLGAVLLGLVPEPVDVTLSAGARWVYVLSADPAGTDSYVQVADAHRIALGAADPLGPVVEVGDGPTSLALTGDRVYVAFLGNDDPTAGGVSVLEALGADCCSILERALDDCPSCPHDETCLVLATIEGYSWDDDVVDLPPAGTELGDAQAAIDNRLGRVLLPSTRLLAEAIECLCERPGGSGGEQGPVGPQGPKGDTGPEGPAGPPAQPLDLGHICALSWRHPKALRDLLSPADFDLGRFGGEIPGRWGLLFAFDRPVQAEHLHALSLRVERLDPQLVPGAWLWPQPNAHVGGVHLVLGPGQAPGTCRIEKIDRLANPGERCNGAIFVARELPFGALNRVELLGDLVRDEKGFALDADHLPPWLPEAPSGNGVPGGTFHSFFALEAAGIGGFERNPEPAPAPRRGASKQGEK
jgi:hypothetical protein